MDNQRTIAREVSLSGVALHTGSETTVFFKPAPVNTGVKFIRSDLPNKPEIRANINNIANVVRGTNIKQGDAKIFTVEHLLAAVTGLGIDNLIVEMNANEPPVGDGSSLQFFEALQSAGIVMQDVPKKICFLKDTLSVSDNGSMIVAIPSDKLTISCTIAFDHPEVKAQYLSLTIENGVFEKELAPSRTFCFYHEVEALMDQGLIKGGSLDNAVVIGSDAIFSKEQLRFSDEFVRHKILDILGDISLLGRPLKAHIIAIKPGHNLNIKLAKKIYESVIKKDEEIEVAKPIGLDSLLDVTQIMQILPHRYPFLLVDRIIEMKDKSAIGIKNVTINEHFFNGHFPGRPVMPGVLILEAMAQVGGVLMLKKSENAGKLAYFMTMENVKFRKVVLPGDQLKLKVELVTARTKTGKVHGEAYVRDDLVTEADLMFSLVEK